MLYYSVGEYLMVISSKALDNLRRLLLVNGVDKESVVDLVENMPEDVKKEVYNITLDELITRVNATNKGSYSYRANGANSKFKLTFYVDDLETSSNICSIIFEKSIFDENGNEIDNKKLFLSNETEYHTLAKFLHTCQGKVVSDTNLEISNNDKNFVHTETYYKDFVLKSEDLPLKKLDNNVYDELRNLEDYI